MKSPPLAFLPLALLFFSPTALCAQANPEVGLANQLMQDGVRRLEKPKNPLLDSKRIINESSSFLKEREPEMTAEEYAIYERVVGMLSSRPEFALKLLEAMVNEKEQPSPAFQFILGNAYYAAGEFAKSEAAYLDAIKRYPSFLRAWSNLAVLYYSTQRYAEAVHNFSKCVALGDRDPMTYGLMGFSLEQEKKIVPAEMAYMQALSADPANTDWLEGLLRIYLSGKQYTRAEWLVKDLIRLKPTDTRFWLTYTDILLGQNRKVEAIALLEVCQSTGVAGTTELDVLASLYADQRLVPEAIGIYHRMLQATPQLAERKLLTFADVLMADGKLDQAERIFNSLAGKVGPEGLIAYRLAHANLLSAQKKWPQARAELDSLLQLEPLNGPALLVQGRVYLAEENVPRAQFAFEAASRIPESAYRASLELATLELKNRRYEQSVKYLEKALSIERTDSVEAMLTRIRVLVPDKKSTSS